MSNNQYTFEECEKWVEKAIFECDSLITGIAYSNWRKKQKDKIPNLLTIIRKYGSFDEVQKEVLKNNVELQNKIKKAKTTRAKKETKKKKNKIQNKKETKKIPMYSPEICLNSLKRCFIENQKSIGTREYNEWRKKQKEQTPSISTILKYFKTFNKAKEILTKQNKRIQKMIIKNKSKTKFKEIKKIPLYSSEICLKSLERCFIENQKSIGTKEYNEWRKEQKEKIPSLSFIFKHFDTFNKAKEIIINRNKKIKKIVLESKAKEKSKESNNLLATSKEICINSLIEASDALGEKFSKRQYDKWRKTNNTHPCSTTITSRLGNWEKAKMEANLKMSDKFIKPYTKKECENALLKASIDLGNTFSIEDYLNWRKENPGFPSIKSIQDLLGRWTVALESVGLKGGNAKKSIKNYENEDLEYYNNAVKLIKKHKKVSMVLLRQELKIGDKRTERILKRLEENKIVSPTVRGNSRKILI